MRKLEKTADTKKAAAQAKSEYAEAQAKNDSPEAETKNESAEAEAEEVEGTSIEISLNDGVEATEETGEEHPGFSTANEETGHIVLRVEHVGHDLCERSTVTTATSTNDVTGRESTDSRESKREDTNGKQTESVIEAEYQVKSILRDAHTRMKRQVLSCYM